MKKAEFEIRPLPNASAKDQLLNSLEKLDGVKNVSIDRTGGIVKVTFDDHTSKDQIAHRIRGAGNKLE